MQPFAGNESLDRAPTHWRIEYYEVNRLWKGRELMKKLLYVDACVNRETSRTERLAQVLLERLTQSGEYELETIVLEDEENLAPLTGKLVLERTEGTQAGDFSHPVFAYAKQFAQVDAVVFAAPYWDFSFPAMLKTYFELLCAQGVTFTYSPEGIPTGLVKAKKAYFVTTVGGYAGEWDYGWDQVRALCQLYFGIQDVRQFRAEGLDIVTNDADAIMEQAIAQLEAAEL